MIRHWQRYRLGVVGRRHKSATIRYAGRHFTRRAAMREAARVNNILRHSFDYVADRRSGEIVEEHTSRYLAMLLGVDEVNRVKV